jgi:hypothetical protein
MRDARIVSTARTPIGKAFRGAFNDTEPPFSRGTPSGMRLRAQELMVA